MPKYKTKQVFVNDAQYLATTIQSAINYENSFGETWKVISVSNAVPTDNEHYKLTAVITFEKVE